MAKRKTRYTAAPDDPAIEPEPAKPKTDSRLELAKTKQAAVGPGDSRSEHYWRGVVAALEGSAP